MRRVNVPRAPSLELYVLPNGGGQLLFRLLITPIRHKMRISLHGAEGDRTPDLCSAIAALSQLSYSPATMRDRHNSPNGRATYPSHTGHNIKAPLKDTGLSIHLKILENAPKSREIDLESPRNDLATTCLPSR